MPKELKNIIKELFVKQKINKLQETEKDIKNLLGKNYLNKQVKKIINNLVLIIFLKFNSLIGSKYKPLTFYLYQKFL